MICRIRWSNMVGWNIHHFLFIFGDDTGHLIWLAVNPPLLCVHALSEMRCVQPGVLLWWWWPNIRTSVVGAVLSKTSVILMFVVHMVQASCGWKPNGKTFWRWEAQMITPQTFCDLIQSAMVISPSLTLWLSHGLPWYHHWNTALGKNIRDGIAWEVGIKSRMDSFQPVNQQSSQIM